MRDARQAETDMNLWLAWGRQLWAWLEVEATVWGRECFCKVCVCVGGCVLCILMTWFAFEYAARSTLLCQALFLFFFSLSVCCCYCCCYSPCCCCCCSAYCALQFSHVDKLVSTLNSRSALHLPLPLPLHLPPAVAVILPVVCLIIGIVVVCVRILRPCQGKFVF